MKGLQSRPDGEKAARSVERLSSLGQIHIGHRRQKGSKKGHNQAGAIVDDFATALAPHNERGIGDRNRNPDDQHDEDGGSDENFNKHRRVDPDTSKAAMGQSKSTMRASSPMDFSASRIIQPGDDTHYNDAASTNIRLISPTSLRTLPIDQRL